MKAAALYARELGWRVLPVTPNGKIPLLKNWPALASNVQSVVDKWIHEHPTANTGVATGEASGFWVLDVDPDKGGNESLAALIAEHGDLPKTVQARTGSGGSHYLFKAIAGITNSADKAGHGLDVRGNGGQIVVSPSRTAKGPYTWVRSPFDFEIAEAPEWLIRLVTSRAAQSTQRISNETRGFFPVASPEVLDQARDALERHGPAIEKHGGDAHTYQAAAMLVHEHALTDDEAWPLLVEWNETCQPPWSEGELRTKLTNGGRYGSRPYGCKRSLDALQTTKKLIADWRAESADESKLSKVIALIRTLPIPDAVTRDLMEKEIEREAGIKPRIVDLPPPTRDPGLLDKGAIRVTTKLSHVANESTVAIAPFVFQRNGVLCEIVKTNITFIHDLEAPRIQDLMSSSAEYLRHDPKQGDISTIPPERVATMLAARRTHKAVRILEAVTTAPIFLADGSILSERGYNEQARVFLEPSVIVDVPEAPTRTDARAAVALFAQLLSDFKFQEPADFSSWVAALLTPLVKAAICNAPAPLFCISASNAGAGKTLLADVIARVVTGVAVENRTYSTKDPNEWIKKLTTFVRMASPVSVFDNCDGPMGDEGLNRLITSATWSDRVLGASDAPPLPNVTTWIATGNNIEPVGDTVRRVLMTRIEVNTERPQERSDFRLPLLADYAQEHRAELLGAALTILRAYHLAGRPDQSLPAWGSFTAWSALVRGALVWAGIVDPFVTQQRAAAELNEPENEVHDFWMAVISEADGSAASITNIANSRNAQEVLSIREAISAHNLRKFIRRFIDKPRAGKRIRREHDTKQNQTSYIVEVVV